MTESLTIAITAPAAETERAVAVDFSKHGKQRRIYLPIKALIISRHADHMVLTIAPWLVEREQLEGATYANAVKPLEAAPKLPTYPKALRKASLQDHFDGATLVALAYYGLPALNESAAVRWQRVLAREMALTIFEDYQLIAPDGYDVLAKIERYTVGLLRHGRLWLEAECTREQLPLHPDSATMIYWIVEQAIENVFTAMIQMQEREEDGRVARQKMEREQSPYSGQRRPGR